MTARVATLPLTATLVAPWSVRAQEASWDSVGHILGAPGASYPHKDVHGRCSFEALVEEHCPTDAALRKLACIVHSADFKDGVGAVPEAAGLLAIPQGFPLVSNDDHETAKRASFLYDAPYATLQQRRGAGPG